MKPRINERIAINVLHLEDSPEDSASVRETLIRAGFDPAIDRAQSRKEVTSSLLRRTYDVILSDFKLSGLDAFTALRLLADEGSGIPFICVARPIGEETVTDLMMNGAVDYVSKERLARLPLAVKRALGEATKKRLRRRAEESLRENEARLSEAMSIAGLGVWEYHVSSDEFTFNDQFYKLLRTTAAAEGGYKMSSARYAERFLHPDDTAVVGNEIRKALETTDPDYRAQLDHRIIYADGEVGHISVHIRVEKDGSGRTIKTHGVNQDVTSRKEVEMALSKNEELLLSSVRVANIGIFEHDHHTDTVYWSDRQREIHGWGTDEAVKLEAFFKQIYPDDMERIASTVRSAHDPKGDGLWDVEYRIIRRDGAVRWLAARSQTFFEGEGDARHPVRTVGAVLDITERKEAEQMLRLSDEIIRRVGSIILISDRDGNITYVSPSIKTVLGYEVEEILGDGWWTLTHQDDPDKAHAKKSVASAARGEIPIMDAPYETKVQSKDGEDRWILWQDAKGVGQELIGVGQDITERKRAEEALVLSERRYRNIFDYAPLGIYQSTPDGRFITVNRELAQILDYDSPDEVMALDMGKDVYYDSDERAALITRFEPLGSAADLEIQWKKKNGDPVWIQLNARAVKDTDGTTSQFEGFVRDITERKQAEEQLRQLTQAIEQSPTSVMMTDNAGSIQYVNPKFTEVTGYTLQEVRGRNPRILKSGETETGTYKTLWATVLGGDVWRGELHNRKKNGELFWESASISPVRNARGAITNFIAIKEDITARKLAEEQLRTNEDRRRELERELIQSQKLEGLGTLASGIAHDFNNLLGVIIGNASLIESADHGVLSGYKRNIDAILKASTRGAGLVRQMLTFARKTDVLIEPVPLNDIVNEILRLLGETFPKTITVISSLTQNLPTIDADATQVHQVLLNLCVNARDAMPNGGVLSIGTGLVRGEELLDKHHKARAERYAVLSVSDTGMGMDEETQMRVFEPFFTTKEHGKGTGLGLSLVFGIMESHGGFVSLHSEPGKGTSFRCYFPLPKTSQEITEAEPAPAEFIPDGTETILVVEDEELLRELLKAILESKGYAVLMAEDGEKGLAAYLEHRGEIAAVISDLGLPRFGGDELYRKLKEVDPDIRMILSSGYIEPGLRARLLAGGVKEIIFKPYNTNSVLRTLRGILDND